MSGSKDSSEDQFFERVFASTSKTIQSVTGVQLGEKQKKMVMSRLSKRLRDLDLGSWESYFKYYQAHSKEETEALVSLLTTHHTFFFREFSQFEVLRGQLPRLVAKVEAQGRSSLRVWSAACSYGQEVYSLAMFLSAELKKTAPHMSYEILGSDVDESSVKISQNGVYKWDELKKVPGYLLGDHWVRGKEDISAYCKAKKSLRDRCRFKKVNLVNLEADLGNERFDVIFCRNVFIYFDTDQISLVTKNIAKHLEPHGLFFVGLSETLTEFKSHFYHCGQSIYAPLDFEVEREKPVSKRHASVAPVKNAEPEAPRVSVRVRKVPPEKMGPLRVLCVDDSKTVLALLKNIFETGGGFEVVGTAYDGVEALEKVESLRPDVVTLDIHMPNKNGIEFLREAMIKPDHPPVVMVSSVSREDSGLAAEALRLGACDYVEKPRLENMTEATDEIRMKVKFAYELGPQVSLNEVTHSLDSSFSKSMTIPDTDKKMRLICCTPADVKKVSHVLSCLKAPQPPTLVVLDAPENVFEKFAEEMARGTQLGVRSFKEGEDLLSNRVYFCKKGQVENIVKNGDQRSFVVLVFSRAQGLALELQKLLGRDVQLVREDIGSLNGREGVWDLTVPYTSFAYESEKALAKKRAA